MQPNTQFSADLLTFTKEITENFDFLCSGNPSFHNASFVDNASEYINKYTSKYFFTTIH